MATTKCNGVNLDLVSELVSKAHALMENTCGESGESFRNLNDELQDNYLWAVADMLRDIRKELDRVDQEHLSSLGLSPSSTPAAKAA